MCRTYGRCKNLPRRCKRLTIRKVRGVLLCLLIAAGCHDPFVEPNEAVCASVCACQTTLQGAQDSCTDVCVTRLEELGVTVPEACVSCTDLACTEIDDCLDTCVPVPAPAPEEP